MNFLIAFLHELWVRFTMKNPKLFRTIQWASGLMIGTLTGLLAMNTELGWGWELDKVFGISVPEFLAFVIAFLLGIFGTAQTPVENKRKLIGKIKDEAPSMKDEV